MKVFLSYRRADSSDVSGRIFDRLVAEFGKRNVFKDVDSIPLGAVFEDHIREQLHSCDVFVAIIGRSWIEVRHGDGSRRLDDPADYVRIEVEQAIASGLCLIPALVGDAAMPTSLQLPESLRALTTRHAVSIRPDPDFHRDMDRLIQGIKGAPRQRCTPKRKPATPSVPPTTLPLIRELPMVPGFSVLTLALIEGVVFGGIAVGGMVFLSLAAPKPNQTVAFYIAFAATVLSVGLVHFGHVLLLGTSDFLGRASVRTRLLLRIVQALVIVFLAGASLLSFVDAFEPNETMGFMNNTVRPTYESELRRYQIAWWGTLGVLVCGSAYLIRETFIRGEQWTRLQWMQRTWQFWLIAGLAGSVVSFALHSIATAKEGAFLDGMGCELAGYAQAAVAAYALVLVMPVWLAARKIAMRTTPGEKTTGAASVRG